MIDWIDVRIEMPQNKMNQVILTTDGVNVAIHEFMWDTFRPIRLIRGKTMQYLPKYWYNLNDVKLPKGDEQ